jgi:AhpD family alkylhydroperoxidase
VAGSRLDRVAVRVLQQLGRRHWGFPPSIMRPLVRQLGPLRAVRWMWRAQRRYERTRRALGPLRTHLACVTISLLNGCRYCAHGHAYALELHHLDRTDRLFPQPATTVAQWAGLPRNELRARLRDALMSADMHVELIWVDRALDLADGGQPIDDQEARIAALVDVFDTLNAVGIAGQPPLEEAHDPLNKDVRLKTRLAALRAAEAGGAG